MKEETKIAQKKALDFCTKYEGWYTFANDSFTKKTIKSLQKKGLVEVNEFNQFKVV